MTEIHGLDELNRRVLQTGSCAACGACVAGCPYLTAFKGKTVMLDRCTVEHGRCFAYCPMTFFDTEAASQFVFGQSSDSSEIGHVCAVMASRSQDLDLAASGQAGGTVSTLMAMAVEQGLIDSAVLTAIKPGEEYPHGVVATTVQEIVSSVGSRYVGAHSLAGLREALDRGFERIGVVGLPCQVRSLRKMALYDLKNEHLKERITLVVGLFCNWAFSSRDFVSFLGARFGLTEVKKFHIPPPPANTLEIETAAGIESISLDDVRPLIQAACWKCPDMTSEFADVSVGMYEGRKGWNTLITRSESGRGLVERAISSGKLETDAFPEENLSHLKVASANKKKRAIGN
jgi:coenzyme F420 hydrogenase subunit beta